MLRSSVLTFFLLSLFLISKSFTVKFIIVKKGFGSTSTDNIECLQKTLFYSRFFLGIIHLTNSSAHPNHSRWLIYIMMSHFSAAAVRKRVMEGGRSEKLIFGKKIKFIKNIFFFLSFLLFYTKPRPGHFKFLELPELPVTA